MKILITSLSLILVLSLHSQSHNYTYPECRYSKRPQTKGNSKIVSSGMVCPACSKQKEEERQARIKEDKRRADVAAAEEKARLEKIEADRIAREIKSKKEAEERKQREAAEKEFDEYNKNQQKYIDNIQVKINKDYSGYEPIKASQKIPIKIKLLKLVENKFAKTWELYRGEEFVKSFSNEVYWVSQLHKNLPYIKIQERKRGLNTESLIDSNGEIMVIGGESYFSSIWFNEKNNTIECKKALENKIKLSNYTIEGIRGYYNNKSDADKIIRIKETEIENKRKILTNYKDNEPRTVQITISFEPFGQPILFIITRIDLSVLDKKSLYLVD